MIESVNLSNYSYIFSETSITELKSKNFIYGKNGTGKSSFGSNLLKYTDGFTKLVPTIFALLAYGGSFYFLSLTLKYFPLNIVYAVWGGMGIVLITLISVFVFHVSINWQTVLGTILIVVGVVIVNLYGTTH